MSGGLVSILVPVHNAAGYLSELIASVRAQTYGNWELLLVDDLSTDQSYALMQRAAAEDARVVALRNEQNRGPSATLNRAARQAGSDILFRLDADDTMEPQRLEKQLAFLDRHPQVGLLGSAYYETDAHGHIRGQHGSSVRESAELKAKFMFTNAMGHSTVVYRRAAFDRVGGYDESLRASLDYDLLARLSTVTECGFLPEPLVHYRTHAENITTTRREAQRTNAAAVQRYMLGHYGFTATPEALQIHRHVGVEPFVGDSAAYATFIRRARGWFAELDRQNLQLRAFEPAAFRRVLEEMHTGLYTRASCSLRLRDFGRTLTTDYGSLRPLPFLKQLAHSAKNGI
ncbi:glycosyl transferase family 2 [Neolewinella xylanilytica]|uniref:Glycosyl transferase family 2 n=1 Tax=Neolewinella xylanilytica TaxID=1514080 RepID=A0A2S6I924_9BACT|nr:glycosyltransferase family A protein [Neolewinella xylanilytica]PPK87993.1 glycosyl transferase family 2 [Neolewinella xylanilytica]